ncbi:hypothetical protein [Bacillus sp. JCM 19041]|uniref:hypothetical protein n=1 Tax=Bacillus sp. JCM 19041 TaxID=1460637 RepID=UPI0006CFE0E0
MSTTIKALRYFYLPICGLLVIPISLWFATGFIGKYGEDRPLFTNPLWLLPAIVSIGGVIIQLWGMKSICRFILIHLLMLQWRGGL